MVKTVLYYGLIIVVIVLVTPHVWRLFSQITTGSLIDVSIETAVQGRVTKCDVNNHNYNWYINDEKIRYNFGAFVGDDALTRSIEAGMPVQNGTGLRYYLEVGDVIHKAANNPIVTVKRGEIVTHWKYNSY